MPYKEWQAKYQKEASAEQKAAFAKANPVIDRGPRRTASPAALARPTEGERDGADSDRAKTDATKPDEMKTGGIAVDRLRSLIERIERLEEERKALASDIKDIYAEAKSAGFDVKVLRQLIRIRKQEPAEVEEQETLLDLYRRALGM